MKKNLCKFLTILLSMTLVLSTLTGVAFAATPEILFEDDFETGNLSKWSWATTNNNVSDKWVVEDFGGSKALNMNDERTKTGILYANADGAEKWSDYIVEYDFTPVEYVSFSGMYFRCHSSAKDGYFIQFAGSSGVVNALRLYKSVNNQNTQLAQVSPYSLTYGTTYKIKIELKGNSIKVYVNDSEVISTTDSTHTQGGIALRSYGNDLYVDNVTVTDNTKEVIPDFEYTPLTGTEIYATGFDAGTLNADWTKISTGNDWSEADGPLNSTSHLEMSQTGDAAVFYKCKSALPQDYAIGFNYVPNATANGYWGVYFKATLNTSNAVNNGYELRYSRGSKKMTLYRVSGTTHTEAESYSKDLNGGKWNIKIFAYGDTIEVKIDDETVMTYEDTSAYTGGSFFVRNYGKGITDYLDDLQIVVEDLEVVSSSIADGAKNVSVDPEVAITFNRPIGADELAGLTIKDVTNAIDYPAEDYVAETSGKALTLTFPGLLKYNAQHSIKLSVNEKEIYSVSFTTEKMAISITSLAVTKADGSAIGALKGETDVKVTVNVKNTDASANAIVYVAAYANDGVMRGVGYAEEVISGTNTPVTVTVNNISFKQDDTNCRLVAFVWSNDGSLTPLALTQSYSNN